MGIKSKSTFPQLKYLISEMNKTHMSLGENSDEMITLFVSFDIVNSTQYKSRDKDGWSASISKIIRRIISQFSNNPTGGYDFWKTLGDEIIYTKKIGTVSDLLNTLDEIYASLVSINNQIKQGELTKGLSSEILSVKAATWLADLSSSQGKTNNILTYYQINDKRRQADYIGPDIDAGFRVSHFSMSNRMVISFEIACLLMRYENLLPVQNGLENFNMSKRIHLLSYKELKGVWDGNPYPILMYHGDPNIKFIDSITELEKSKFPIIQDYINLYANKQKNLFLLLDELCLDLKLNNKITSLMNLMKKTGSTSIQDVKDLKLVHYSVACYTIKDNVISFMLVKNKKTNEWGFGVADFFYSHQFVAQTEKGYMVNYGADISVENDYNYHERIPLVVSYTKFSPDDKNYMSRAIFLGHLNELPNLIHDEIIMISENEIDFFKGECTPLFKELFRSCGNKIHELEREKDAIRLLF